MTTIGVPAEIKTDEQRVGLTPTSVAELTGAGHAVVVQSGAGHGIGADDDSYSNAGATIANDAAEVFEQAQMIVKVKEPLAPERAMLRPDHVLFTYLHLAADQAQTNELIASGALCIAYETVTSASGALPLLTPMSQVAGRMATQAGAHHLEAPQGGGGVLIGGVPGVPGADVVVIGGGVVGENAIDIAIGMGAEVTVLDRDSVVLDRLEKRFGAALRTMHSNKATLHAEVVKADLVIGAVLVRGARAPKLVSAEMIKEMQSGSVVVDVAIDQGGCIETARPTTHTDPTYVVDDVVHYCVANMPGAVPRTSTYALNNQTLPFVMRLANDGAPAALRADEHLRNGLNVMAGQVTEPSVAETFGIDYVEPLAALG